MSRLTQMRLFVLLLLFVVGCTSTTPPEEEPVEGGSAGTVVPTTLPATIAIPENTPQNINFLGATFTFDPVIADSVQPELLPAQAAESGPGVLWASPEHIVFTLVDAAGSQNHASLGQYLTAEAQIHLYPTAELNVEVQPAVDNLRQLLAQSPDAAALEVVTPDQGAMHPGLSMLPPSNAVPMFRAQAEYLTFAGGRGIRYLTQLSQGLVPVNNQELFYTFQGLTDDGAIYIAAYFPVTLPALPATSQMSDEAFATLVEDWQRYLSQTLTLLNEQTADAFTPDLAALDALISSLSVTGVIPPPELVGVWPDNNESVDNQPILQWAAYSNAVRYELVVVDDDAYPPVVAFSQFTTETVVPITPALEPGSYSWTVRALDGNDTVLAELNRQFWVKATPGMAKSAGLDLKFPHKGQNITTVITLDRRCRGRVCRKLIENNVRSLSDLAARYVPHSLGEISDGGIGCGRGRDPGPEFHPGKQLADHPHRHRYLALVR